MFVIFPNNIIIFNDRVHTIYKPHDKILLILIKIDIEKIYNYISKEAIIKVMRLMKTSPKSALGDSCKFIFTSFLKFDQWLPL